MISAPAEIKNLRRNLNEKEKDDSEYWNAMKMRASANQLPDVMFNKTFTLARFKDYLIELSDTQA